MKWYWKVLIIIVAILAIIGSVVLYRKNKRAEMIKEIKQNTTGNENVDFDKFTYEQIVTMHKDATNKGIPV